MAAQASGAASESQRADQLRAPRGVLHGHSLQRADRGERGDARMPGAARSGPTKRARPWTPSRQRTSRSFCSDFATALETSFMNDFAEAGSKVLLAPDQISFWSWSE